MTRRIDTCQPRIVQELRELGCAIADTHMIGKGYPDILLGWRGISVPIEIKGKTGKMTKAEVKFQQTWRGSLALLRDMGGCYMLTVWRDGLHVITVQLADMGAVLETLEMAVRDE